MALACAENDTDGKGASIWGTQHGTFHVLPRSEVPSRGPLYQRRPSRTWYQCGLGMPRQPHSWVTSAGSGCGRRPGNKLKARRSGKFLAGVIWTISAGNVIGYPFPCLDMRAHMNALCHIHGGNSG